MTDWTPEDEKQYQLLKSQIQSIASPERKIGEQSYEEYLKQVGKMQPQDTSQQAEIKGEGVTDMWYDPIDMLSGNIAGVAEKAVGKSLLSKSIQKGEQGIAGLFGKAAKMSGRDLETYLANSKAVEALRTTAPEVIQDQLNTKIKTGIEGLISKDKNLKSQVLEKLPQKNITINKSQFNNASDEVKSELERIIKTQHPPKIVKTGIIDNAGNEIINELPPKIPENISITARQAQALKEVAQDAAKFKQGAIVDPISHEAKRKVDATISSNLRKGIEGVAPEVAPLNKEIARTTRYSKTANKMVNNPEAITKSGLKARALANVLEKEGGATGLSDLTNQYLTTKSKSFEPEGLASDLFKGSSRAGIRGTKAVSEAAQKVVGAGEKIMDSPVPITLKSGAQTHTFTKQVDPLSQLIKGPQEPEWSDQDEQEYQVLKSQVMQLQGK